MLSSMNFYILSTSKQGLHAAAHQHQKDYRLCFWQHDKRNEQKKQNKTVRWGKKRFVSMINCLFSFPKMHPGKICTVLLVLGSWQTLLRPSVNICQKRIVTFLCRSVCLGVTPQFHISPRLFPLTGMIDFILKNINLYIQWCKIHPISTNSLHLMICRLDFLAWVEFVLQYFIINLYLKVWFWCLIWLSEKKHSFR